MQENVLKELEYISKAAGVPVCYTQGGGGNTSAKLDDELMAVKASGYKLKQISPKEGYVVVNYKKIREFYENVDLSRERDYEKEGTELVKNSVVEMEGLKKLRPSIEAGFHSILKKYVIHTHPVYANILCCSHEGSEMVKKIFADAGYATAWIPYTTPGFGLTVKIMEAVNGSIKACGMFSQAIFMENHGLIVTDDDSRKCEELHREVNDRIRRYLGLTEAFPEIELRRIDDNTFVSGTGYIREFFRSKPLTAGFFDNIVLYPDQLVYLNVSLEGDDGNRKLNINAESGEIVYKAGYAEALTIEETLLAYAYVVNEIGKSGLSVKTMSPEDIDFIRNWESEAYRKSLVKDMGK